MSPRPSDVRAIADRLDGYARAVEIGVGNRPGVAGALADRGVRVTATDVHERSVSQSVTFVRDDVTDPDLAVYEGADLIYALRLPPELHGSALAVARRVGADFAFTTLGGDPPAVAATPETVGPATLFWARGPTDRAGDGDELG